MKPVTLNDLLLKQDIDPARVIVMRHSPKEKELREILPWLVHESPDLYNAYQQSHSPRVQGVLEKLCGQGYVASFIGTAADEAVFAGLYCIAGFKTITHRAFWQMSHNRKLADYGMIGWKPEDAAERTLWFDLKLQTAYADWIGKLVISWPPPAISWWRRSEKQEMRVLSIREESVFSGVMPDWQDLVLTWSELQAIPKSWQTALKHWRGIYFIHDRSDGKGYVGSASGGENLLGRWRNYAESGDGGNKLLRGRKPENFRFSILQIVAHDLGIEEVVGIENSWKKRLHTIVPSGLNVS